VKGHQAPQSVAVGPALGWSWDIRVEVRWYRIADVRRRRVAQVIASGVVALGSVRRDIRVLSTRDGIVVSIEGSWLERHSQRSTHAFLGSHGARSAATTIAATSMRQSAMSFARAQLAHETTATWSVAKVRQDRNDDTPKTVLQVRVTMFNLHDVSSCLAMERWTTYSSLHYIVRIWITEHALHLGAINHQLLNHHRLGHGVGNTNALFDDVRAELLFGQLDNGALEAVA
jgi:hypothetical protein